MMTDPGPRPSTDESASLPPRAAPTSMLGFVRDAANLLTLAGLACAVSGIYFAILGNIKAAMIALLWAILADWFDGPVARRTPGRSKALGTFGGALDSLVDIVSLGVLPAVVLLSYGAFSPWYVPGAILVVMAGVVRLSYFDVFGLEGGTAYTGLPLDINGLVLTFAFLFEGLIGPGAFRWILYGLLILLAALNVSSIQVPKMVGVWYFVVSGYVLAATTAYGAMLWY